MKRKLYLVFVTVVFLSFLRITGNVERYYQKKMIVTETDSVFHEVYVEDGKGNVYCYYADDLLPEKGTEVVCTFDTMFTTTSLDDEIVKVR